MAEAIFAGTLVPGWPVAGDPLSLSEGTIFVPTRRAARSLAALIAERIPDGAVLLPRIVPLGDVDEAEEAQLFEALSGGFAMKRCCRRKSATPPAGWRWPGSSWRGRRP